MTAHDTSLELVAHADWSCRQAGRALIVARRWKDRFLLRLEDPGPPEQLIARLADEAGTGRVVLGFDFPLGLPRRFAERQDIDSFPVFLRGLDRIAPFFEPAADLGEIRAGRPFYPRRPGGASRATLAEGHGVASYGALLRHCDLPTMERRAACCLFWTLGPQQCGRAAIAGWRDALLPAFSDRLDIAIWPFDGLLKDLLAGRRVTICETYPAQCYRLLGLARPFAKTRPADRLRQRHVLEACCARLGAVLAPALSAEVATGFAQTADHGFDALCGVLGMLRVLRDLKVGAPEAAPPPMVARRVEGWMLGLPGG